MTTLEARCLDAFPDWLRSFADDARALATVLETEGDGIAQRRSAAALNYLFKSLDLIPDGLEDLGFIDDAFVIRAAVQSIELEEQGALGGDPTGTLARLAGEANLIQEFLDTAYERLTRYVTTLDQGSARGRSVASVVADAGVRADFLREVGQWAEAYVAPSFKRDSRNLVKLKSFLLAKLPA